MSRRRNKLKWIKGSFKTSTVSLKTSLKTKMPPEGLINNPKGNRQTPSATRRHIELNKLMTLVKIQADANSSLMDLLYSHKSEAKRPLTLLKNTTTNENLRNNSLEIPQKSADFECLTQKG
jgi:hypothetical protein